MASFMVITYFGKDWEDTMICIQGNLLVTVQSQMTRLSDPVGKGDILSGSDFNPHLKARLLD